MIITLRFEFKRYLVLASINRTSSLRIRNRYGIVCYERSAMVCYDTAWHGKGWHLKRVKAKFEKKKKRCKTTITLQAFITMLWNFQVLSGWGRCLLMPKYFYMVNGYAGKADLSKGQKETWE